MFDVALVILIIGFIVAVAIVGIYYAICVINKKMGYDANGNYLNHNSVNQQPQVIKIQLSGIPANNIQGYNSNIESYNNSNVLVDDYKKAELNMDGLIANMTNKKVETTFENKRIGKV